MIAKYVRTSGGVSVVKNQSVRGDPVSPPSRFNRRAGRMIGRLTHFKRPVHSLLMQLNRCIRWIVVWVVLSIPFAAPKSAMVEGRWRSVIQQVGKCQ